MDGTSDDPRANELTALHRIAALGTHDGDLNTVVREILRAIDDVTPCEQPLVFLHDEEADELRTFLGRGDEWKRIRLSEPGIIRRIFTSGRGEVLNDVTADPDATEVLTELRGARQIAGAPLVAGDSRLGVIAAVNSRGGAFTDLDLRLLSLLADRAAITLRSAHLRATLERQGRELDGLQRLSQLLVSTESLEYVIGESVRIVTDLVQCEKMMVLLYDDDQKALCIQPPAIGIDEDQVTELTIPLSEPSLASTVFRTSTPLVSNDAAADAWVGPRLRALLGIKDLLVVPLHTDRQPIGVLEAINSKKGFFDDEDLRSMTLLGGRVGAVIELSRSRVRERALVHKLREADRAKSDFVSILAHELKSPMTAIQGFGQTLEQHWDTLDEDKKIQFVSIVRREIERLGLMVSDLLDMSRMESGTVRYELVPTPLQDLVDNVLAVHTSLRATHEIRWDVPGDLPKVVGDKDRLRQVLINLLTNATRYSPEGTTITIAAEEIEREGARFVQVGIGDEGIGIAPDDVDRIFSKFAMLPKPAWTKKGTGLGLFISKGIIEAHQGRLWVESTVGEGSTFYFTVPVATDEG